MLTVPVIRTSNSSPQPKRNSMQPLLYKRMWRLTCCNRKCPGCRDNQLELINTDSRHKSP
jgi:hypothetical protein